MKDLDTTAHHVEQSTGEFNSTFLGVRLNSAFQPIYDIQAGD
jgi:hypothetical protein